MWRTHNVIGWCWQTRTIRTWILWYFPGPTAWRSFWHFPLFARSIHVVVTFHYRHHHLAKFSIFTVAFPNAITCSIVNEANSKVVEISIFPRSSLKYICNMFVNVNISLFFTTPVLIQNKILEKLFFFSFSCVYVELYWIYTLAFCFTSRSHTWKKIDKNFPLKIFRFNIWERKKTVWFSQCFYKLF